MVESWSTGRRIHNSRSYVFMFFMYLCLHMNGVRHLRARYEYQKKGLIKNGTTCVTKTTTHTSKKLRKWPNRDRTTPSSMALFGHYLAKNHPTKNAIEQKYSPRARASSGHAPWRCPTDFPFHGFPPALLTIFYIMNRQQGSRSG